MSASRQKGTRWESTVRDHLNESGVFRRPVERAPLWGAADRGDLLGTGSFVFECKAVKAIDLSRFVDEAEAEAHNANARWGVAVIKRRNHQTKKAYVAMTFQTFIDLIKELPVDHR